MGSGRGIGSPSQRLTASAAHATDGELASKCWKHARCQSRTHPLVLFSTSCHVDAIMSVGGLFANSARANPQKKFRRNEAPSWYILDKSLAHTSLDAGELAW